MRDPHFEDGRIPREIDAQFQKEIELLRRLGYNIDYQGFTPAV